MMCKKSGMLCGLSVLALGILFLLRDLGVWNFWNIQWWTALFLLVGVGHLSWSKCADCQAMDGKSKKGKR